MILETRRDHVLGDRGHPLDDRADVGGHGEVGHPEPGDLGDVDREVAHPLELADHPQRGDDGAQVAGDRLLQRQQQERRVLDPLAGPVDLDVRADHLLGDLGVAGEQRLGRKPDGDLDAAADGGEVVEDAVELFVECLSHGTDPKQGRCPAGVVT